MSDASGGTCVAREQLGLASDGGDSKRPSKWIVRPMRDEDIPKCLEIWNEVGLTEAHLTVSSVLATDPDGFNVAQLEDENLSPIHYPGEVIGMCAGPMTRDDTAFMGFYAVKPGFQGLGIGRALWATTKNRLDESKNIGLYGVPSMSSKYKKSGFKIEDCIRMVIYESGFSSNEEGERKHKIYPERLGSLELIDPKLSIIIGSKTGWRIIGQRPILEALNERALFEKMVEFDATVNNFSRRDLLSNYLLGKVKPITIVIVVPKSKQKLDSPLGDKPSQMVGGGPHGEEAGAHKCQEHSCCEAQQQTLETSGAKTSEHLGENLSVGVERSLTISAPDGTSGGDEFRVVGYGCVKDDNTGGGMIGPLYAESDEYYELILQQLIESFPLKAGGKFSVMSLTSNWNAGKILEKIGFREIDQCSRMFTKFVPQASLSHVYFVHSPNFTLF